MTLKHDDPLSLRGTILDGRYAIDAFVAQGGFGVVYRGRQLPGMEPIAVKVCKHDPVEDEALRSEAHAHFLAEAAIVAKLSHPAIVRVHDFGVSPMPDGQDTPWLVFEWASGRTLADDLSARWNDPPRSPTEVLTLVRPVLQALATAHAQGIAHRDLKPANLMLMEPSSPEIGVPMKVLDFGVSKQLELDERCLPTGMTATRSTTIFCSPENATPEQLSASRTGPWTDVYQLALVITEMLTHETAHGGDTPMAAQRQAMSPTRPTPAAHGVDVGAWEPVLARAVALRPADRYPEAGVFLEALEATLPGGRRGETLAPGTRTAPLATSSVFATPTGADEVDDLAETAARTNPHPPASALPARAPAPPPSPPTLAAARAVPSAWMVVVVALIAAAAIAAALSRF